MKKIRLIILTLSLYSCGSDSQECEVFEQGTFIYNEKINDSYELIHTDGHEKMVLNNGETFYFNIEKNECEYISWPSERSKKRLNELGIRYVKRKIDQVKDDTIFIKETIAQNKLLFQEQTYLLVK